jgi:cobalamin biosynthesis protein CbiD
VRNVNGTCTWSCAAAAAVSAGAAPGLLAEGSKRYSISVKRPSGGTNETDFDWVKRLSLSEVVWSVRGG